jgi:uncharacterized protein YpmB
MGIKGKIQRMLMIFIHAIFPVIISNELLIISTAESQRKYSHHRNVLLIFHRTYLKKYYSVRSCITVGQYHIKGLVSEVPQESPPIHKNILEEQRKQHESSVLF